MTRAIPKQSFARFAIQGIERAFKAYDDMSGEWLDYAPEYFVATKIAEEICRNTKTCVTMEHPVTETLKDAEARIRGRPHGDLRRNGRFDVVLWWKGEKPRAALEVKHPVWSNYTILDADIKRLCHLMKQPSLGSTIQFSMLAIYLSSNVPIKKDLTATARLKRRRTVMREHVRRVAAENHCKAVFFAGPIKRIDKEAWTAECIVFQCGAK